MDLFKTTGIHRARNGTLLDKSTNLPSSRANVRASLFPFVFSVSIATFISSSLFSKRKISRRLNLTFSALQKLLRDQPDSLSPSPLKNIILYYFKINYYIVNFKKNSRYRQFSFFSLSLVLCIIPYAYSAISAARQKFYVRTFHAKNIILILHFAYRYWHYANGYYQNW